MLRVFVSYRQSDGGAVAASVVAALEGDGHEVFRDDHIRHGVKLGDDLVRELYDRIDRCDVVVAIVSAELEKSRWCFAELMTARALGKRVIPVIAAPGATHDLIDRSVLAAGVTAGDLARLRRDLASWDPGTRQRWDWKHGPFPGLHGFTEDDAPVFFGRDDELRKLRERLLVANAPNRLVALVGPSGSGKSSLLRAGLLATLARDRAWHVAPAIAIDQRSPIEALAVALEGIAARIDRASTETAPAIAERWTAKDAPVLVRAILRGAPGTRLLVAFDQFEQLYIATAPGERERFLAGLQAVVTAPLTPVHAVLTLRVDHLNRMLDDAITEQQVMLLGPLRGARMRTVITGPARAAELAIDDELVDQLVADAEGPDGLPLLSAVLEEMTVGLGRGDRLDRARYHGVAGVLVRLADEAIATLAPRKRDAIVAALMQLVTVDEAGAVVRRAARAGALDDDTRAIFDAFADRRLLVREREHYDVAHEALFRAWPPLAEAIDRARDSLRLEAELAAVAHTWQLAERPDNDYLWGGDRLARAEAWLGVAPHASSLVREFIAASRVQGRVEGEALVSNVALRVETEIPGDPERALGILLAAQERHGWSPQVQRVVRGFVQQARVLARLVPPGIDATEALSVDVSADGRTIAGLFAGVVSPSPRKKAVKAVMWRPAPHVAGVWDRETATWLWARPAPGASRVRITAGGDRLVIVAGDDVQLVDARTGASVRNLALGTPIHDLRFAATADRVVSIEDGALVVRTASSFEELLRRPGVQPGRIWVSPDGERAIVHDAEPERLLIQPIRPPPETWWHWMLTPSGLASEPAQGHGGFALADWLRQHGDGVDDGAFARFAIHGDGTVLGDDEPVAVGATPRELALDREGALLAAAVGREVVLIDRGRRSPVTRVLVDMQLAQTTLGHAAEVLKALAPGLGPAPESGTVRTAPPWIRTGRRTLSGGKHGGRSDRPSWGWWQPAWPSPGVTALAVGSGPLDVYVLNPEDELLPQEPELVWVRSSPSMGPAVSFPLRAGTRVPVEPGVVQAAVNEDATRCYAVRDTTLEIWDVAGARRLATQELRPNGPLLEGPLVVSRDGRYLAAPFVQTPGYRSLVIDLERDGQISARGRVCAFSRDGQRLVSCQGETAYVMTTDGLRDRVELFASFGWIYDLAFSPSGNLVAAACQDSGLSVLDLASRIRIATFSDVAAIATAFGETDEDLVALTKTGEVVRIELLSPEQLRARAARFVHTRLADLDRRNYNL